MTTRTLGQRGELLAVEYLRQRGYDIVATNWRCGAGELDVIAKQGETLVFVEVRTRCAPTTEAAFESVNARKQEKLARLAYLYLAEQEMEPASWRIDIIAVAAPRSGEPIIEHREDALEW